MRGRLLLLVPFAACHAPGEGKPTPDGADPDTVAIADSADTESGGDTGPADDTDTGPPPRAGIAGLVDLGARNVIFVHTDTFRADHLPMYGYARDTLPESGRRGWLVVEGTVATSSWTVPSSVSVLTGLEVRHHGVTHMTPDERINAGVTDPTLARHLESAGYATFLSSGNQALPGVDGVFDEFDEFDTRYVDGYSRDLEWLGRNALAWVDTLPADKPFFVWLQPMDTHGPYDPAPEHWGTWSDPDAPPFDLDATESEQLMQLGARHREATTDEERAAVVQATRDLYDELILGFDVGLAHLLDGLASRGLADSTLVVVVADHGESIGEESGGEYALVYGHGGKVREELVHVPFLVHHPRIPPAVEPCLSSNIDVLPTVLRAVGIAPMPGTDGVPLQEGCRATVSASAYLEGAEERTLSEIMVTDGVGTLRWDCWHGWVYRYDLATDPAGLVRVEADAFPGEGVLTTAMEVELAAIRESFGDVACTVDEAAVPFY